jgi:hypothetical protein
MQWFLNLMEELGIECLVGHPATIRAAEPRKQKHDRRDADLILTLLAEKPFPSDLVTYERTLGFAGLSAAPASMGVPESQNPKCAAGHGLGKWSPARFLSVDPSRPTRYRVVAVVAARRLSAE